MRFKDVNDALLWVRENISKKALKGRISKSLNEKCIAYGYFWRYLAEIDDVTTDEELEQDTK